MWAGGKDPEEGGRNYFNLAGGKGQLAWACVSGHPTHPSPWVLGCS